MAKLQKSEKQRQRHSLNLHNTVSKLSPEEIQLLNDSVAPSQGSQSRPVSSAHSQQPNTDTPPLTPECTSIPVNKFAVALPTPPQSPFTAYSSPHADRPSSENASFPARAGDADGGPETAGSHPSLPVTYSIPDRENVLCRERRTSTARDSSVSSQKSRVPPPLPFAQFSMLGRPRTSSFTEQLDQTRQQRIDKNDGEKSTQRAPLDPNRPPARGSRDLIECQSSTQLAADEANHRDIKNRTFLGPQDLMLLQSESEWEEARTRLKEQGNIAVGQHSRRSMPPQSYPEQSVTGLRKLRRSSVSASKPSDLVAVPYSGTRFGSEPKMKDSLRQYLPSTMSLAQHGLRTPKAPGDAVPRDVSRNLSEPDATTEKFETTQTKRGPTRGGNVEDTKETENMSAANRGTTSIWPLGAKSQKQSPDTQNRDEIEGEASIMNIHPALRPHGLQIIVPKVSSADSGNSVQNSEPPAPVYTKCGQCGRPRKVSTFQNALSPVHENENTNSCSSANPAESPPIHTNRQAKTLNPQHGLDSNISPECNENHNNKDSARFDLVEQSGDIILTPSLPISGQTQHIKAREIVRFPSLHFNATNTNETKFSHSQDIESIQDFETSRKLRQDQLSATDNLFRYSNVSQSISRALAAPTIENDDGRSEGTKGLSPYGGRDSSSDLFTPEYRGRSLQRVALPAMATSSQVSQARRTSRKYAESEGPPIQKPGKECVIMLPGEHGTIGSPSASQAQITTYPPSSYAPKSRMSYVVSSASSGATKRSRRSSLSTVQSSSAMEDLPISQQNESQSPSTRQRGSLTISQTIAAPNKKRSSSVALSPAAFANAIKEYVKPRSTSVNRAAKSSTEALDCSLNISRSNPKSRESTTRAREQSTSRNQSRHASVTSVDLKPRSLAEIFAPPNPPFLADARSKT